MNIFSSVASRLKRLADEMAQIDGKSFSDKLKRIKDSILSLETELDSFLKVGSVDYRDTILEKSYLKSGVLLSELKLLNIELSNVKLTESDKKDIVSIRESAGKILKKLGGFYKLHLNPKFHVHGITHKGINQRMNEIRESYRILLKFKI